MTKQSLLKKSTAIVMASTFLAVGLIPAQNALAHDRHKPHSHHASDYHAAHAYKRSRTDRYQTQKHYKKNSNGDLIAAGIIGLAIGAIIADNSNSSRSETTYVYQEPQYVEPEYNYPRRTTYHDYQRQSQYETYNSTVRNSNEPNIVRYEEAISLEPWTAGWREWCQDNYRSFNPSTGTFRGYDGQDHFCVPK